MASTEGPARPHDRHSRRRPFASWMKRLANLKNIHVDSNASSSHRNTTISPAKGKKAATISRHNNPYPFSRAESHNNNNGRLPSSTHLSSQKSRSRHSSLSHSRYSISHDGQGLQKSRAPTLATTAETTISDTGRSGAGTTGTVARTEGDRDSTFSSPAPSLRSMTTTLTTMQSTAPPANQQNGSAVHTPNTVQFPATQPATAIPSHLAPHGHPVTWHGATANNVLTDDASVLTLASSSKRRRRNSVDTNASVKALAPASMFGGSRESLPLSVLSGTANNLHGNTDNASLRDTSSTYYPRSASVLNAERASLISASGVTAPALASERNSYIGTNKLGGDGASVRSGRLGHGLNDRDAGARPDRLPLHGRNDSLGAGSIGGSQFGREREMVTAPTSPMPL